MPNVRLSKRSISGLILATYAVLQTIMLICSSGIQAAEYRLQSSIALMAETDDNARLQAKDGDIYSLQGESAILNVNFSSNQENRSLSINNRFATSQYDLNRYNSEDFSTTVSYQRSFERGSLSLDLSASDESIRTLENQFGNDGSTEIRTTKATSYSFAISGQRQLTERQFLQNQFSVQQRDYDSDNRSSYDYFSNSLLWVYSINSALSLQANLSLSSFRPEKTDGIEYAFIDVARNQYGLSDQEILSRMEFCANQLDSFDPYSPNTALSFPAPIPNFTSSEVSCFNAKSFSLEQDAINLQIGLQYQWTENLSLNLLIGSSYSETEQDQFSIYKCTPFLYLNYGCNLDLWELSDQAINETGVLTGNYIQETEQDNLSFNVDLNYQYSERASTALKASQSQEQTAYGLSVDTRRVSLSNMWKINEVNSLNLNISQVERNRSFTESNRALYSDNIFQLNISHIRYWQNNLRSNLGYLFTERDNGNQQRNRWMLTLTWQPEALNWSK